MGNANSEIENEEIVDKKKSIKKKRTKKSKSLKRKNKIIENEYDNTNKGAYPEFF